MTRIFLLLILLSIFTLFFSSCQKSTEEIPYYLGSGSFEGLYFPTQTWRQCTPEDVGMSSEKLEEVFEYASNPDLNTRGLIVIKRGYIVLEAYFNGADKDTKFESYSVAKSFTGALAGIALEEGFVGNIEETIDNYLPEVTKKKYDPRLKQIRIRHLLSMMSGIEWHEEGEYGKDEDDAFLMMGHEDYTDYVLSRGLRYIPGEKWYYSSGDTVLLSAIIERASGSELFDFAEKRVFSKIGMRNVTWDTDGTGMCIGAWGLHATLRDFAKFGFLYQNFGFWGEKQIVPKEWIKKSLNPVSAETDFYGYQWWLLPSLINYKLFKLPDDIFLAWGLYTQQVFVIPSHEIVIVRFGHDPYSESDSWDEAKFLSLVMDSEN